MSGPSDRESNARASAELRVAYARQQAIVHAIGVSSPDFTYIFDEDQRFIYVSPSLLKLWGRTLDEAVGKNFEDLGYAPELVALHRRQLDEALSGKTVSGSNKYVSPAGVEGYYEYTFVPVSDEGGRVTMVVGTTRDVTARVRADREREEVLERLRESEEQFRHFADAMPNLAWIAHADGYIYWYNQRWHEYTGTTAAQMEGWGWQSVHDPNELPRVLERWKESIASGLAFEMSFPLRGADGRFRWFLTRSTPVRGADGAIIRWFGTNTDIDEQRRALIERDAALAAADEAIRFRDEFLTIASHELKTPLAGVLLNLELLKRVAMKRKEVDVVLTGCEKARASALRLDRLIGELLDISRVAAGQLRLEPEPIDAAAVASDVCATYAVRAAAAGSTLTVVTTGPVVGSWDRLRLEQVISNLVDNALKYGPGKPVEVEVTQHLEQAVIRVTDHGPGIPESDQDRIFDRFARGVPTRHYGGFGLGLWIARQIVDAAHGRIEVTSTEGKGATFTVTLPVSFVDDVEG